MVVQGGRPAGAEVRLVQRLAEELDAEVEWTLGSESDLVETLHAGALDLVVAGLDAKAPWTDQVTLTHPYLTTRAVVASRGTPPDDVAGRQVAVREGTAETERVRALDAVPVPVPDVAAADGLVVVDDWMLEPLRLRPSEVEVSSRDHVWAVPMGENGWQVTVESFLLRQDRDELVRLLAEVERR